jgi:hypothetical protein
VDNMARAWFIVGDQVAREQVFTRPKEQPIISVLRTRAYDVLDYLVNKKKYNS